MACRLFGAKPLSEPMLGCCQLDPYEQTSVKFESIQNFSFTKMHLKISSAKRWPFCLGGDELNQPDAARGKFVQWHTDTLHSHWPYRILNMQYPRGRCRQQPSILTSDFTISHQIRWKFHFHLNQSDRLKVLYVTWQFLDVEMRFDIMDRRRTTAKETLCQIWIMMTKNAIKSKEPEYVFTSDKVCWMNHVMLIKITNAFLIYNVNWGFAYDLWRSYKSAQCKVSL